MKKIFISLALVGLVLAGYLYFSNPYRGCSEISVGSGFSAGYDCGNKTIYIPRP